MHARMTRAAVAAVAVGLAFALPALGEGLDDLARIQRDSQQGFTNAGWRYDRYRDLPTLDAHKSIVVADLEGPGIIRHFHTTRHHPADKMARGVVLEIWFDGAKEPAVLCPLADFFGDGCNGSSMYFSTPLIECAPWSYNCYIPMPFRKSAKVILRNDTDQDTTNYSYVEWEKLPAWDDDLSYFHATYARARFQLTPTTKHTFFETRGAGHVIGRQFSVLTKEPMFRDFGLVMEGNNEIDVDGTPRAFDYLGSEDSFTFSWGFQAPFAGLRAGMPHVSSGDENSLSIYRFHDHMPIRFDKSLTWRIDWSNEWGMTGSPVWKKAVEDGGCWVDYASVFYWYQTAPGGYRHEPLPEARLRGNVLPTSEADLVRALAAMPLDPASAIAFDTDEDLQRVQVVDPWPKTHPFRIDTPEARGGHPGQPNPGRSGILAVHPKGPEDPVYTLARLTAPEPGPCTLQLVVSGDPYELPGQSEFVLRVGFLAGDGIRWTDAQLVDAGTPPSEANWRTLAFDVPAHEGNEVGVVVQVAYGGPHPGNNEEAFLDEIRLLPAR